jgi:hypothetical protein
LDLVPCQPRPFRPTTTIGGDPGPIPDLVARDFHADTPGTKLVGDITYLPTWQGWLYLATVIDCHTKACIGYAMAEHMRAELSSMRCRWPPVTTRSPMTQYSTLTVSMCGPVFPGFLTRTAMDTPGCWCQVAPGLPDPHFRLTTVVFPRICRLPGSTW